MNKELKQYRDPLLSVNADPIGFYEREFFVLSNFSSFAVEWHGRVWPTSEHAYQAAHFFETAPELVEQIAAARSAHDAYKIAKANADKAPANWHDIKPEIMLDICRHKLQQHPYVRQKLLETVGFDLAEDSPKDDYWGWGPNKDGRNQLGKTWMQLRDEITN